MIVLGTGSGHISNGPEPVLLPPDLQRWLPSWLLRLLGPSAPEGQTPGWDEP
jgi:hypothetical protein